MEFDLSAHPRDEEARLWVPYPVSDKNQVVKDVRINGDYAEAAVYTDRIYEQPMLFARWDKGAKSRKLIFNFRVQRDEVARRDFPAKEAAWDPADYAKFLHSSALGPTSGKVKDLADEITNGKTTVLSKARAVYDWVVDKMRRDPSVKGCGAGDVCALIDTRGGKCVDIHSVFVALARAAGVPSREVFGIRLGEKDQGDITGAQHCWAEFYLPGYGWVPVDPADVRKAMLAEKLDLNDPRTEPFRSYYWGGIDPHRVKLGTGRDLVLNPPQNGAPLNYLMYPFAEIGDETLDWYDPQSFKYKITWRKEAQTQSSEAR